MAEFDLNNYFSKRQQLFGQDKVDALQKASAEKIQALQESRARDQVYLASPQAQIDKAIAEGRTWGEFGADVGLSAIQGVDALAKLPAMVYDKATEGNFYGTETQKISAMSDEREKLKSAFAQAKGQQKAQAAKDAGEAAKAYVGDGALGTGAQIAAEFGSAFWEAAKDPASIPDFLAQQAAQLGVMGKVGRGTEMAAQAALKAAPVLGATKAGQAAVNRIGTAGAVGTGAVLQGTDVGSDTMTRILKLPDEVWDQNPEYQARASEIGAPAAKQEIASRLASEATIQAGAASLLSAALPGGTAIEKALVGKSLGGIKAIPKSFVGESGQEGFEEGTGKFFGNAGVKQIDPTQSLSEDVGASAGQGAFMGGLLGAGISGVQTAGNAVAKSAAERALKVKEEEAKKQDLSASIASGDVTAYVDPKSPSYAPEKAVQALFGNSQKEDATPEIKQANFAKAESIVADLKNEREKLELELVWTSPEKLQEKLDANRADYSPELLAATEEGIATLRETPVDPQEIAALEQKAKAMDSKIQLAESVLKSFIPETQNTQIDVEAEVAKLKDADPVVAQGAADSIINLSMTSPELVDRKLAASLVSDTTNNLTDSQRDYLRAFSEARVAENSLKTMGDVSKEIYFGSEEGKAGIKYTGLTKYRSNVSLALAAGNQKSADRELGLLTNFEASHQGKAKAASEAYSAFLKDGIERRVERNQNGSWKVEQGLWESASARAENGGLNIKEDSPKIVADTKTEADAISKTASELKAAYAVKFGSGNTSGASNVQNVSQAPAGVQGTQEKLQAEAPTETGTTETVAAAGTGNAAPATSNAPTGIDAVASVNVWAGTGENTSLSNLATRPFELSGRKYFSVEHAYQSWKSGEFDETTYNKYTSGGKKIVGNKGTKTEKGWNIKAMKRLMLASFKQNPDAAAALLATGNAEITHKQDKGIWAKEFPRLLMEIRSELAVDPAQEAPASVVSTVETAGDPAQLQSTEQTTATSEEVVPQTEAVAEPTGLSALQQKSTEGTPYVERNLLADYLKQSGKRPLVMVKDFVTALKQQTAKVMDYLDVKEPTDKQKAAVQLMARKVAEWGPVIKGSLVKGYWNKTEGKAKEAENFRYTDLMQFLIEGTNKTGLDLEENIKTAIVYAAMRATVDSGDNNRFNSPEDINDMFGRTEEHEVSETEQRILANVGLRDNNWRNRAGQAAVQALGLKAADENTPIDLLPRLESAFGAYIQKLLMDRGIMVRETLSRDLMEELFVEPIVTTLKVGSVAAEQVSYDQKTRVVSGSGATPGMWVKAYLPDGYRVKAKADKQGNFVLPTLSQIPSVGTEIVIEMLTSEAPPSWQFMKLARDAEGNAVPAAQQILEGLQGTGNVLDKLFGVESLVRFPLLQAAEFKDKSQKGVNEGIPENLREAVNQKQQEAGYLREDSWAVLNALPEQAFLEMHGWVDIENTTIQAMDLLSVQAKNEGIVREYNRIKQFVSEVIQPAATEADSELGAVPFYPEMFVAKQQRVFQKTNGFNQQTSKMHRNVYRKGSWAVDISVSDETAMDNFRLRVLEALGTKTDAQTNDRTLAQFDAAFDPELQNSPKGKEKAAALRDAIKSLQKVIYKGTALSDAEVQAVIDGVAKGGEKGLTLAALQDMAHYMQAMETKAQKFPVQFQGEIDGKTNGVIISQLLFGGAESVEDMKNRMRRGGLFFEGDEQSQFNAWKQEGNLDQYESLAKRLNEIAQLSLASDPKTYAAIEAFTKPLSTKDGQVAKEGRDFTKNPLTTLMFGSTLYSAVDKMGDKLIAQISKRIVDVVDGNTPSTMKEVLQDLNVLITRGGGEPININMSNAQALSSELSTEQIKAIKRAFHNSLGDAAKQAFEEEFGTYLQQRSIADEAANLTFALSNAVITGMREDYVNQLIADGVMPVREVVKKDGSKEITVLRALNKQEEREFQKQVGKLIPRVHTAGSKKDGKQSSGIGLFKTKQTLSTNPVFQGEAKFGTPFADTIGKTGRQGQSLEAFSAKLNSNERVQEEPGISTSSKQVHSFDSTVARGAETLLAAQGIETDNNHDALTSGLNGFTKVGQALNQSFYTELSQYSPMGELSASLNGMVQNIISFAVQGEGNNLTPTAQKNLAAVLNELVKTYGLDAVSALNLVVKNTADAAYRADKIKLETLAGVVSVDQYTLEGGNYKPSADERQAIQDQLAALSPEVKLGVFEAVDSLVALMGDVLSVPKARENKTRGRTEFGDLGASSVRHDPDLVGVFEKRGQLTAKQLVHVLRKKFPENTVNREILEKLVPLLNAGLVVKYITPDAASADVLEMAKEPSRGWFVSKGGKQEIYVLGTQFKDSGLTAELLLHEALHAALSQVINRPQSADAKALVAELQTLLTEAKAIVASDASLSSFAPAVSSVDELVSWGLTNKDFQVKVLSKVRMQSRTSQNRLVSGMKAFVDAVASLLFRRPDKNQNHGVFVLVQNVSGLMAEAANNPQVQTNVAPATTKASPAITPIVSSKLDAFKQAESAASEAYAWDKLRGLDGKLRVDDKGNLRYPEAKVLVDAYDKAFAALMSETRLVIAQASSLGTVYAQSLKDRLESIANEAVAEDRVDEFLLALREDADAYLAEFNQLQGSFNFSMASQVKQINSFTTLQIHEALDTGAVDPAFQSQLANLLTGIVDALHGPFGAFAAALRETEAKTPTDAWAKAKELGVAPFGSSVLSHMAASEQEAFAIEQVEATVKAALDGNDAQAKIAYRELYNLYTEMYNKFSKDGSDFFKGDWAMATPSEKAHAKSQHDFVFDLKSDNGDRSDYLARFAALGLAHQGFNQMLQVTTESDVGKLRGKESFEQRLRRWFSSVLGMFRERVTKTYAGQLADDKLQTLVVQLVDIEAKKRSLIQAKKGLINTGMVEDGARAITEGIRTKIAQAADSEFLRKQPNTAVQVVRSAVSTIANDRSEKFIEGMQKFYERNVQAQGSVFVSVLKELTGHKEKLQAAFRIVKKFEGDRQDQIAGWAKDARKAFGKKILRDSSASITAVVMRTGLHYLSDTMSLAEIERLVDNPVAQNAAIAELEAKLSHMKAEYVTQIKGLGYYKATELVKVKTLMMNSYLISRLAGTVYEKQITEAQANAAEPIIKQLVSLYALKYTSRTEQALAKQVFRDENTRGESVGNGIDFVMKAQKALEAEAFERQFRNNPALMVHGFTPEILNPHTEFVVATEAEGQALVDFGYKKGAKVSKDSADPDQSQKYIYVLKGAGLAPHVSGALQFQSDTAKGTKAHSGYLNVNTQDGLENAQTQARFDQKLGLKIETDPNWDPSQEASNYTAPLYNENGKVVNWRYMMNKQTKDELLDRNNSFDRVLGVLGGTVFSKPKIKEQNRAVLEALKEIYKDDYALNAESYVEVGPKSNDPELRSFWERLPEQTKEDVRAVWKGDSMKVTADSLDVVFGYRKLSLADPIRQSQKNKAKLEAGGALTESEKQGLIAQNFVLSVEWAFSTYARIKLGKSHDEAERYAKRAAAYVTRGERAWQEVVREIKTIYVIKNVKTMVGNNISNVSQLLASGVSLKAIREHLPVALKSATAYMADMEELRELENQLETGYTQGNEAEIERKIIRLRDAIARNPARELIEAGLMPSIVEDVGEADDPFSYKTEFARKTERFTDKLNPKVKEAAKFVYMTRDGKLYKALHQATQISDFVARYTMYQHLVSREQKPLSKTAAIQEVSEAFVNYDMAMHRNIQFMDDMGFMMFTKYYLRMQKVLLKMGRENPARVLALAAADGYLNLGSIVLDSSALAKIGNNPFGVGAFGFPGALDDLATVKAAMALVK